VEQSGQRISIDQIMRNVGMSPSIKDHVLEKALASSAVKDGGAA